VIGRKTTAQGLKPGLFQALSGPAKARALIRTTESSHPNQGGFLFLEIKMTREEILAAMLECKEKLGYTPSREELARHTGVTRTEIRKFFGTYTIALTVCRLDKHTNGRRLELPALFEDWATVARKLGKLPTVMEHGQHGKYSVTPFMRFFSTWSQMPVGLKQYAEENGLAEQWADVLNMVAERFQCPKIKVPISAHTAGTEHPAMIINDGPLYGPLLTTCPL
jgi:Homing endonuclease associated repeat